MNAVKLQNLVAVKLMRKIFTKQDSGVNVQNPEKMLITSVLMVVIWVIDKLQTKLEKLS